MIQISNLTFGYSKKSLLFENLNLEFKSGHIYGLLGGNGAGKSTLLKNLCGLVYPLEGNCQMNNYIAADRQPGFLQEIFFIPDDLYMPSITTLKFLNNTAHFYPNFDQKQFLKILADFDVPADKRMDRLSFGQQKKIMISFGIAANTSLLIMDEPTNGLDIPSKIQFRKVIASVLTEEKCIIISTHEVRDLDSMIDNVVIIHKKEILINQALETIAERIQFTSPAHANRESILYTEENMIGANTISTNAEQKYGKVDLEMLFNAVTSGNQSIINLLK